MAAQVEARPEQGGSTGAELVVRRQIRPRLGIELGPVDVVKYAEAFGAKGFRVRSADEIAPVLRQAFAVEGPALLGIEVDYRDNAQLFASVQESELQ